MKLSNLIIGILILILLSSCNSQRNMSLNKFYDKYSKEGESLSFSAPGFLAKWAIDDPEIRKLGNLRSVKVYTLSELSEKTLNKAQTDLENALKNDGFENYMRVNSEGNDVSINVANSKNKLYNFLIAVQDGSDLVLVQAKAKIKPEEIGKLLGVLADEL